MVSSVDSAPIWELADELLSAWCQVYVRQLIKTFSKWSVKDVPSLLILNIFVAPWHSMLLKRKCIVELLTAERGENGRRKYCFTSLVMDCWVAGANTSVFSYFNILPIAQHFNQGWKLEFGDWTELGFKPSVNSKPI